MNLAATIAKMRAAGMSCETIVTALECIVVVGNSQNPTVQSEQKKSQAAKRQAAYRARRDVNSSVWRSIRAAIIERDGGVCHYCGQDANTVDHKTPLALGGTSNPDNLVAACRSCNSGKGGRDSTQWKGVHQ